MILAKNDEDSSAVLSFSSNLLNLLNPNLQKYALSIRAPSCIKKKKMQVWND